MQPLKAFAVFLKLQVVRGLGLTISAESTGPEMITRSYLNTDINMHKIAADVAAVYSTNTTISMVFDSSGRRYIRILLL